MRSSRRPAQGRTGSSEWRIPPRPNGTGGDPEVRRGDAPDARNREVIALHVTDLQQLFNAMDPSPFRGRDLSPGAEEYIVESAREAPRGATLELVVHIDRLPEPEAGLTTLRMAVRQYFDYRRAVSLRKLSQLFRTGRTSLLIGLGCLALSIILGDLVVRAMGEQRVSEVFRESLLIGGWVAMWRPLDVFLYDWWPIRAEVRLFERLAAMPVRIEPGSRQTQGSPP